MGAHCQCKFKRHHHDGKQQDGQAVVDLLNEPTTSTASDDLGTLPEGALFDDSGFPAFGEQSMGNGENDSLTEMLYGAHGGTLNAPVSGKKMSS